MPASQVRVPNWMDKARAPAKERQKWDKLVAAMFDYESRHKGYPAGEHEPAWRASPSCR